MPLSDYLPFAIKTPEPEVQEVDPDDQKALSRKIRSKSFTVTEGGFQSTYSRTSFENNSYEFDRINRAIDTDSYMRQGVNKYKELMWKEGWIYDSEDPNTIKYLKQRIQLLELAMRQPFNEFLVEIGDQLVRYHNCFIVKARADIAPYVNFSLNSIEGRYPVAGYYILPAETVEIERDKNNRPVNYRQRLTGLIGSQPGGEQPKWRAHEVIHLAIDKKPGRAFGSPFLTSVIDDVVALRQIEEDIQNLVHKELFPLYKYKVGTEKAPAEPDEVDAAWDELEGLRSDGGIVLPERHDIDVVGNGRSALDAKDYLAHFVNRVCAGIGVSPHHLGIMSSGGNRSVTDRLDIAMYDKVKTYQRYIEDAMRLFIINELLYEAGFDPLEKSPTFFRFKEIDVDTQVKKETHVIQKWQANISSHAEARREIGYDDEVDEDTLLIALQERFTPEPAASGQPSKPDAKKPASKGQTNKKNDKGTSNKMRPANQHGRKSSPSIRHSADWASSVSELLNEEE